MILLPRITFEIGAPIRKIRVLFRLPMAEDSWGCLNL